MVKSVHDGPIHAAWRSHTCSKPRHHVKPNHEGHMRCCVADVKVCQIAGLFQSTSLGPQAVLCKEHKSGAHTSVLATRCAKPQTSPHQHADTRMHHPVLRTCDRPMSSNTGNSNPLCPPHILTHTDQPRHSRSPFYR